MTEVLFADVVVVGAGVHGSSAALHLARAGKDTLLLEKFPVPHIRGSSHGQSRITRRVNYSHPALTAIMDDALTMWYRIQEQAGVSLVRPNPVLMIAGPDQRRNMETVGKSMEASGYPLQWADPKDVNDKYKMNLPANSVTFFDPTGAVLMADKCVAALQHLFRAAGGRLVDEWPVDDVKVEASGRVEVRGARGVARAGSVVLCPGPWAGPILAKLGIHIPLKVERISVLYWRLKDPNTPSTVFTDITGKDFWGIPELEYPGMVKIGFHYGPTVNPDRREVEGVAELREVVKKYIKQTFPGLHPEPAVEESGLYTITPDRNFVLDRHPRYHNIVFACGFSGTGFKIAPAVGDEICRMVLGQAPKYDLEPFSAFRFDTTPASRM